MRGGMSAGQSAEVTKQFEKVAAPEGRVARLWRKLRGKPAPYELVEVVPQDPPQPVRGHVHMLRRDNV